MVDTTKAGRILLIGKDPALFGSQAGLGDTLERHVRYAQRWRESGYPNGGIKIICYTNRDECFQRHSPASGLELIPTRSVCRGVFVWDAWRKIKGLQDEGWTPDLISPQTPWEEGNVAALAASRLGAKLLPQLHFDLFSGNWRKEHWLNPLRYWCAKRILSRADGVRVVSEALKKKSAAEFQINPDRIYVSPVPISLKSHEDSANKAKHRNQLGLPEDQPLVLYVGRFAREKNLDLWIEVALKVADDCCPVQFVLVGEGEERARIENILQQSSHKGQFHFTGQIQYPELPDYFAAADVFLLSSNYEGCPRVVVEAGFSSVPVVSTQTTSPGELIEDQDTGFLLECGDVQGLADAVRGLLQDANCRRAMGQRARAKMQREQSPEVLEERLMQTWRSVLAGDE